MRLALLFGVFGLCTTAHAQNWALLNPAYRYNYSNDGTDTISNQIRVMHVDTLGVDSFRYELNTITEYCDTCFTGNVLRFRRPQFMQRTVTVGTSTWKLDDPSSLDVYPNAVEGESWLFDPASNVTATITQIDTVDVFGITTPRKTISLSDGGQIVISRDLGVLQWRDSQLIGVHGPDLGRLIPSLSEVFPFQTGDVVEYRWGGYSFDGWNSITGSGRMYKFTFSNSVGFADHIEYSGWRLERPWYWVDNWSLPWNGQQHSSVGPSSVGLSWIAGQVELPFADLVNSYPGELIRSWCPVGDAMVYGTDTLSCIAEHGLDSLGRHTFGCKASEGGLFRLSMAEVALNDTILTATYDYGTGQYGPVQYVEGIGLSYYRGHFFESNGEYELTGAIINGETQGYVHTDPEFIALGLEEHVSGGHALWPNPADDRLIVAASSTGSILQINDPNGRMVLRHRIASFREIIDIHTLPPGIYIVTLEGYSPQRVVIAR